MLLLSPSTFWATVAACTAFAAGAQAAGGSPIAVLIFVAVVLAELRAAARTKR